MVSVDDKSAGRSTEESGLASLLRNRNFMLLWAAYGISAMGDHLSEMAVLKTQGALDRPDCTQLQAKMTFAFMAPFLLGPLMGWVADRLPRKWIMIAADLIRVAIMFNFAMLIERMTPFGSWGPFLPLAFVGLFAAMFSPARSSMVPMLVRTDQLVSANAMISALGIIGTTIAVLIGGYLADHANLTISAPSFSFRLDALTFLSSAICVFLILVPRSGSFGAACREGVFSGMTAGIRYIRHHRPVMELIAISVAFWFAAATVRSVIPALVKDVYGGKYLLISYLQAAMVLGMVCGAGVLTGLSNTLRSEIAITWSYFVAAVAVGVLAFSATGLLGPTIGLGVGLVAIALMGMAGTGVMTSMNALLQRITPDRFRGRVFGVKDLSEILGLLVATGLLGIPHWPAIDRYTSLILGGIMLMLFGVWFVIFAVRIRRRGVGWVLGFWRGVVDFYSRWWWRMRRDGICTIPRYGPVILAANHRCTIDPVVLSAASPHRLPAYLMIARFINIPFFNMILKRLNCIPVRRDGRDTAAAKAAIRHLRQGGMLGIFPEGGIPVPGEQRDPKVGVALLALRTGATVVPAFVSGTRYSDDYFPPFIWRHHARVRYGKPIDLSGYQGRSHDRATLQEVANLIMARINELNPDKHGRQA